MITPESMQELQRLLLTKQPSGSASSITPDVGSITPLSPYEMDRINSQQFSRDPVIANMQKLGRGIKDFLVPQNTLDAMMMGIVPLKVAKGITPSLKKAKEMGFDIKNPAYHGSSADITSFKLPSTKTGQIRTADTGIFFSSSPRVASSYSNTNKSGSSIYPVFTKSKDYLQINPTKKGMNWDQLEVNKLNVTFPNGEVKKASEVFNLSPNEILSTDDLSRLAKGVNNKGLIIKDIVDVGPGTASRFNDATNYLNKMGYRSALPQRTLEDQTINAKIPKEIMDKAYEYASKIREKPSDITVVFDPSTIRSTFAKFDPTKASSSNLLAGVGGLSLLATNQNKEQ
tara:strand:+ start:46 stop:1074 length:1029 start_codon:yes stop_codon:yes gene_type:complete